MIRVTVRYPMPLNFLHEAILEADIGKPDLHTYEGQDRVLTITACQLARLCRSRT